MKQGRAIVDSGARQLDFNALEEAKEIGLSRGPGRRSSGAPCALVSASNAREPQLVQRARERLGESRHPRDRLEVGELPRRERIEHGVRRNGFRPRVGTWNAPPRRGMRSGRPRGEFGEAESADAEGGSRVTRDGA